MRQLSYILLLGTLLALSSCGTSKTSIANVPTYDKSMSLDERFNTLTSSYTDWEDLSVPFKATLDGSMQYSLSGRASMERGKSILLSFRMLGMEVVNVYITQDTVFVTEKMHKYYFAESIESLFGGYWLTVGDIQDLLLGRPFLLGEGTLMPSMLKQVSLSEKSNQWLISPKKQPHNLDYYFALSDLSDGLTSLFVEPKGKKPVECKYSGNTITILGMVAEMAKLSTALGETVVDISIKWELKNAKWNTGKLQQWKAPQGYRKIELQNLKNIFSLL